MGVDSPIPLATSEQFKQGAFADLASGYSDQALADIMIEATRSCETTCARRLAPFTGLTEVQVADGVNPDELTDSSSLPLDLQGSLGRSYASALGAVNLVRRCWLSQYAPVFQEYWEYDNVQVSIMRSYGGGQTVTTAQILQGPEPDTGHLWFQLGLFLPLQSRITITYDGGYTTVPADLKRACIYKAAATIARELDPLASQTGHSPGDLDAKAEAWLKNYVRS